MLQACLNGTRAKAEHAPVPVSADECAAEAGAAVAAGARDLHVHPRGPDGAESLDREAIRAAVGAIRGAGLGVPIGVSTGLWIVPGGDPALRARLVGGWRPPLPDHASVNFSEPGARDLVRLLLDLGVAVDAGLGTPDDAGSLLASGLGERCRRVLIEPPEPEPAAALATAAAIDAVLDAAAAAQVPLPRRQRHGSGHATWHVIRQAVERDEDARIGFEDTLWLPDGTPAASNADLVRAARELLGW